MLFVLLLKLTWDTAAQQFAPWVSSQLRETDATFTSCHGSWVESAVHVSLLDVIQSQRFWKELLKCQQTGCKGCQLVDFEMFFFLLFSAATKRATWMPPTVFSSICSQHQNTKEIGHLDTNLIRVSELLYWTDPRLFTHCRPTASSPVDSHNGAKRTATLVCEPELWVCHFQSVWIGKNKYTLTTTGYGYHDWQKRKIECHGMGH